MALFPSISIEEIDGLSSRLINRILPSLPISMSSNCPVENKTFAISLSL